MKEDEKPEQALLFASIKPAQTGQVMLIGAIAGAFSWILAHVLGLYVLKPASCSGEMLACAVSSQPALVVAALIAACVGLFGLVKLQVFRPLLVVVVATAALWGTVSMAATLPWYLALICVVLFYALTYTTFMWIARIRIFWLAVLICLVLMIAVRLIITA